MKHLRIALAVLSIAAGWASPAHAAGAATGAASSGAASWFQNLLWQEHYYWDALISARDRAARQQADPHLLPVVKTIAQQTAQQVANLQQIISYTKAQQDNLRFAFSQQNPARSLATIQTNLETLSKGTTQIRNNLYYLTTRCRMASSQALPDPELTSNATILIGQIQAVQLGLNTLYADAVAIQAQVAGETWLRDKAFRYQADHLLHSVVSVQDAVFTTYNSAYELYMRSK